MERHTFVISRTPCDGNDSLACGRTANFACPYRIYRYHRSFRRASSHRRPSPHATQRPTAHQQQWFGPFAFRWPAAIESASENWWWSKCRVMVHCTGICRWRRSSHLAAFLPTNIQTMCRWQSVNTTNKHITSETNLNSIKSYFTGGNVWRMQPIRLVNLLLRLPLCQHLVWNSTNSISNRNPMNWNWHFLMLNYNRHCSWLRDQCSSACPLRIVLQVSVTIVCSVLIDNTVHWWW